MRVRQVFVGSSETDLLWCGAKLSEFGIFESATKTRRVVSANGEPLCAAWNKQQTLIALGIGDTVEVRSWPDGTLRALLRGSAEASETVMHVSLMSLEVANVVLWSTDSNRLCCAAVVMPSADAESIEASAQAVEVLDDEVRGLVQISGSSMDTCSCDVLACSGLQRCTIEVSSGEAPSATLKLEACLPESARDDVLIRGLAVQDAVFELRCHTLSVYSQRNHSLLASFKPQDIQHNVDEFAFVEQCVGDDVECATIALAMWTLDRCLRVHCLKLSLDSASVVSNDLVGEVSAFTEGASLAWCGVLGAGMHRRVVVARNDGFVGLEVVTEACNEAGNADDSSTPDVARQESEDTVLIAEGRDDNDMPTAEAKPVESEKLESENPPVVDEHRQLSTDVEKSEEPLQQVHTSETAVASATNEPAPDTTAATTVPQPSLDRAPAHSSSKKGATKAPAPAKDAIKETTPNESQKPRKQNLYRAGSPSLDAPPHKPPVPRRASAEKPVKASSPPRSRLASDASSLVVGDTAPQAPIRKEPKGPGVDISLDTADLEEHRDCMHVYVLSKLLGESWDTPVVFIPLPPRYNVANIRDALEKIHQKRLSICFATPAGKLIELRPSTLKIFQSYDDNTKQIYCRSLYPTFSSPSPQHEADVSPQCTSGISDVSAIHPDVTQHQRKLSEGEQKAVCSRLHDASMEASRRTRLMLEQRYWPCEAEASVIDKARETGMIDRLYKQSELVRKSKIEALRQRVDAATFGEKAHLSLPEEQRMELAEKFYTAALQQYKKRETEEKKREFPRLRCRKLSGPEEWAAWQESMSRDIKKKFKTKNPYTEGS